jgi:hypothetical protein
MANSIDKPTVGGVGHDRGRSSPREKRKNERYHAALRLEQGLHRVGDKILDADHGVKGGFAAASCPEPEVRTDVPRV